MKTLSRLAPRWVLSVALSGAGFLTGAAATLAQGPGGGMATGGTGGGGGQTGSSLPGIGQRQLTGGGTQTSTPLAGQGATTPGGGGAGSTNAVSPSAQNAWNQYYTNPLKPGLGSERKLTTGNFQLDASGAGGGGAGGGGAGGGGATTASSFGGTTSGFSSTFNTGQQLAVLKNGSMTQPLYAQTAGAGGTAGIRTGTNTGLNTGLNGTQGQGFNTLGQIRAPSYSTRIAFDPLPKPAGPPLGSTVRSVLDRSSVLKAGKNVAVAVNGEGVVVLNGSVATDRERRVAEVMVRMTPGVREVRNEIVVNTPSK